jgi:hypothetical protein
VILAKLTGRRVQWMLAAGAAIGVLLGTHLTKQQSAAQANIFILERLEGTWELRSLKGEAVGTKAKTALLSQRMTFRQGRVMGVTRLRAGTEAATNAMPFPDASVRRVRFSEDGLEVLVYWDGTYQLKNSNHLDFTIGKAMYGAGLKFNPQTSALELEHDTILTYPGAAVYAPPVSTSTLSAVAVKPVVTP